MKIKEVIVVEGKSDIVAVKRALGDEVDLFATHGLGLREDALDELERLSKTRGLIVFTDPDYGGKRIRNIIRSRIPAAKFAFIPRKKALKKNNIGVENASDEDIIEAIKKARPEFCDYEEEFTIRDIIDNGLSGIADSKEKRIALCRELSLEYSNGKQLLLKLNSYGIKRREFEEALRRIDG